MRTVWIAACALALATHCATSGPQANAANPCAGGHGNGDPQRPIVCIDPNTLAANPDTVELKSGKWIHFFINNDTGDLDIVFPPGTPVKHKGRNGAHYWAQADTVSASQGFKYTIRELSSGRENDPIIIIEP